MFKHFSLIGTEDENGSHTAIECLNVYWWNCPTLHVFWCWVQDLKSVRSCLYVVFCVLLFCY